MPIVYISSTYRDLKPYRDAAARAARAFDCKTIAMEDYVAKDERPLDECLADVRRRPDGSLVSRERWVTAPTSSSA